MSQYMQVNWINGMKITSNHFIELENHFIHRIQNSFKGVVNELSYGLIPGDESDANLPQYSIAFSENKLKLLSGITAITSDGYLIQLPSNLEFSIAKPISDAFAHYLVITINPFDRVEFGLINEQESPLRYPDSIARYEFHFLPQNPTTINSFGKCVMPIGRFTGPTFEEDKTYIPPCTSIQSHPALIKAYKMLLTTLNELEKKTLEMLKDRGITNRDMLINLVGFFNESKTAFDTYIPYLPPVFMLETIGKLARIIFYSCEIKDIRLSDELKGILQGLINSRYDHLDIGKAVANIKIFTDNYAKFLPKHETRIGV